VIGRVYDLEKRLDLTAASQMALGPVLMANSVMRGDSGAHENTGNKRGHGSAGSTGLKMGQSC
jgi:hypothetical protein